MGHLKYLPLVLAAGAQAIPRPTVSTEDSAIQWGECDPFPGQNVTGFECANFDVPLDYASSNSTEKLSLELLRAPAKKTPSKGSILFNFGGPGLETRHTMVSLYDTLSTILGTEYDLLTWDPRGTANTMTYSCYDDPEQRSLAFSTMGAMNSSDTAKGSAWTTSTLVAKQCEKQQPLNSTLIGTAYTARDAMQIVDALGEDGKLRFWGFSYGSLLGATLAAMFPDRMDKVVIDGVLNHEQYYSGFDTQMWADFDSVFTEFVSACVDHPEQCALAKHSKAGTTASDLEAEVYDYFENVIRYQPVAWNTVYVSYTALKSVLRTAMYSPYGWSSIGRILDTLIHDRDWEANFPDVQAAMGGSEELVVDDSPFGIQCGDKTVDASTLEEVMPALDRMQGLSRLGGDVMGSLFTLCAQWSGAAKEKAGHLINKVKTETPVLLVGNTWDPATPLRSAHKTSEALVDSVVLESRVRGHGSISEYSLCTYRAIRKYFEEGVLPEPGTVCESSALPFTDTTGVLESLNEEN